jgi:hypothetical protein
VKKVTAENLGTFCKAARSPSTISQILGIFLRFAGDSQMALRKEMAEHIEDIVKPFSLESRSGVFTKTFLDLLKDPAILVRNVALRKIADFLASFPPRTAPDELVKQFAQNLLISFSADENYGVLCAANFPALILASGPRLWGVLEPAYQSLWEMKNDKVLLALSKSFLNTVNCLSQEKFASALAPILLKAVQNKGNGFKTNENRPICAALD